MSSFKISGVVTYISPVEKFGAGKESKRIIVETQDKYPNFFPVTFYGDKMNAIDGLKKGDYVEVDTFPGGRLKKGDDTQAFCFLNGWTCNTMQTGQKAQASASEHPALAKFDDGIPF